MFFMPNKIIWNSLAIWQDTKTKPLCFGQLLEKIKSVERSYQQMQMSTKVIISQASTSRLWLAKVLFISEFVYLGQVMALERFTDKVLAEGKRGGEESEQMRESPSLFFKWIWIFWKKGCCTKVRFVGNAVVERSAALHFCQYPCSFANSFTWF